jgi:hypothetical protein
MFKHLLVLALLLLAPAAQAQFSGRDTYIYSLSSGAVGGFNVQFESSATRGMRVLEVCVTVTATTAQGGTVWSLVRTNTVSSGGTLVNINGTSVGAPGVIQATDRNSPNWSGVARYAGTGGTASGVIDQWNMQTPPLASEAAPAPFCRAYGTHGENVPYFPAGVANGFYINFSGAGAGGTSTITVQATLVLD